ncbi:MAG TPA: hypothetical protein VE130_10960 [Nitrososphaeraceae archaeon]|nr:hypothetical protein [Nitrososphaeraceae archaeon]
MARICNWNQLRVLSTGNIRRIVHKALGMRRPVSAISLRLCVTITMIMMMLILMVFNSESLANKTLASTSSIVKTSTNDTTTITNISNNIKTEKIRVGDIDIAYKIFGEGERVILSYLFLVSQ